MHKKKKSIRKKLGLGVLIIALMVAAGIRMLSVSFRISPPEVKDTHHLIDKETIVAESGERIFNGCFLRQSDSGLWEVYLQGNAFDRGIAAGKLEKDLLEFQEKVFIDQIKQMIPSEFYLKFLRIFIAFFNRNLASNIPEELKEEIYGISLSCTHDYDFIGSPYERQLNYHSAHDLGHALQDYMLVGCTSFAAWGNATEDSTLLIGRNFDFYAGDDFAKNKTVTFYAPETGYKFVSVAWAGMAGIASGMNEKGLTVTINAAKTSMPSSSATPISILCREILQYASTLEEARRIAGQYKLFVSESILIGSAIDESAEIIEKSPDKTGIYTTGSNWLVCANHFQSETFQNDKNNLENIETSDSPYRQQRMEELIREQIPLNPVKAAGILRDRQGLGGKDIGLGNEKAINQLIGHHSVIFKPVQKQIWVSTHPWQLGQYVCYDLNVIFANLQFSSEIRTGGLTIPPDTFLNTETYMDFLYSKNDGKKTKYFPIITPSLSTTKMVGVPTMP
ncbi:acyl-CoA--6-aminopenicillanic acid acyl-transferase [Bacteroidia bacterium]|nr:acyl-CoA--6-aminopenicillanic acid acyl-transferase [Bacteroidia bacterium]